MFNYRHIFVINFFILAVGLQQVQAEENTEITKLENFYYDKCYKNSGSRATFEKLRTDTYEMYKYFEYTFDFLPDNRETFCKSQRSNLEARIKQIAKDLKPCLRQEEEYLADFIKESFSEFLHFFCHNSGEYTRKFFSTEGAQCRQKIGQSQTNDLDNCMNRIFSPTRSYIAKKEMCDDITVARKCFGQLLEVHCPNSNDFKRLNDAFFNFVGKPCSSCMHLISSFALIGSLLVHFIINKF